MITTRDSTIDRRVRARRQHGMNMAAHDRHTARAVTIESYDELGFNYRLTDIQAAIGQCSSTRLPDMVRARRRLADRYARALGSINGLTPPYEPAWARSNWQTYCVRLPDHVDQQVVMQHMLDRGVATRPGVMCIHREPAYPPGTWTCAPGADPCTCSAGSCRRLAESARARDRSIQLPLFPDLQDDEQARVVEVLAEAVAASVLVAP